MQSFNFLIECHPLRTQENVSHLLGLMLFIAWRQLRFRVLLFPHGWDLVVTCVAMIWGAHWVPIKSLEWTCWWHPVSGTCQLHLSMRLRHARKQHDPNELKATNRPQTMQHNNHQILNLAEDPSNSTHQGTIFTQLPNHASLACWLD